MAQNARVMDSDLSKLGRAISAIHMTQIAVGFLRIPIAEVESFQASAREDVETFKLKCLECWRNKNDTKDSRRKLFTILTKASKDGLLDSDRLKFLIEDDGHSVGGKLTPYILMGFTLISLKNHLEVKGYKLRIPC